MEKKIVKIKCRDCGRIVEVKEGWDKTATCNKCEGYFDELDNFGNVVGEETKEREKWSRENPKVKAEKTKNSFSIGNTQEDFDNNSILGSTKFD